MNPVILLSGGTSAAANGTPAWSLNQNYADNIRRAGGIPLLAVNNDCAEEYADLADGLLLSGGKDVAPALYGEELKYDFVITDPLRDDLCGPEKAHLWHLPRRPGAERLFWRHPVPGYP